MNLLLLLLLLQCAELCVAYRLCAPLGQGPSHVLSGGARCGFGGSPIAAWKGASCIKDCLLHASSISLPACPRGLPSATASAEAAAPSAVPNPSDYSVEWEFGFPGASAEAMSPAAQPAAEAAAPSFAPVDEEDSSRKSGKSSSSRMRLTLTLSNNHVYACITDRSRQHTFAFASSMDKCLRDSLPIVKRKRGLVGRPHGGTMAAAAAVGALVAARGLKAGISKVFFDRKSYRYGGRVAALADAARKTGLDF